MLIQMFIIVIPPQVLQGADRKYSKHNNMMVPDEILINKKLCTNLSMFQKWVEFFYESGTSIIDYINKNKMRINCTSILLC